jgi:hypothetical protein
MKRKTTRQALGLVALVTLPGWSLAAPSFPKQEKVCTYDASREFKRTLSAAQFPDASGNQHAGQRRTGLDGRLVCCANDQAG